MQIVTEADDLEKPVNNELKSFGDDYIYIERYFTDIRHLEVQILGTGGVTSYHLENVIVHFKKTSLIEGLHQ